MQCKLVVALQLKVPHHFIEKFARERARVEDPTALGAAKTPKVRLFNPYQLPAHGGRILQAANLDGLSGILHT
jgi:hypothetical protein